MGKMRDWLDDHHIEPEIFRTSQTPENILLHFRFASEDEARDFAEVFDGELLDSREAERSVVAA